jgi:hypothetical protein
MNDFKGRHFTGEVILCRIRHPPGGAGVNKALTLPRLTALLPLRRREREAPAAGGGKGEGL